MPRPECVRCVFSERTHRLQAREVERHVPIAREHRVHVSLRKHMLENYVARRTKSKTKTTTAHNSERDFKACVRSPVRLVSGDAHASASANTRPTLTTNPPTNTASPPGVHLPPDHLTNLSSSWPSTCVLVLVWHAYRYIHFLVRLWL